MGFGGLFDDFTTSSESSSEEEDYTEDFTFVPERIIGTDCKFHASKFEDQESKGRVVCLLYFEKERRVITGDSEGIIRIWSISPPIICTNVVKSHKGEISKMIKWSNSEFLTCGSDGFILSFSKKKRKVFCDKSSHCRTMIKLDEQRILLLSTSRRKKQNMIELLVIMKNSKNEDFNEVDKHLTLSKSFRNSNLSSSTKLVLSKKYENSCWVSLRNNIHMINFENDEIVTSIPFSKGVSTFEVHINSNEEEVIVCLDKSNNIDFFNTKNKTTTTKRIRGSLNLSKDRSLLACNNLLVSSCLKIFDLNDGGAVVFERQICRSYANHTDIQMIGKSYKNNMLVFSVCSREKYVTIVTVNLNIDLKKPNHFEEIEMDKRDRLERIQFLRSDEFMFGDETLLVPIRILSNSFKFPKLY